MSALPTTTVKRQMFESYWGAESTPQKWYKSITEGNGERWYSATNLYPVNPKSIPIDDLAAAAGKTRDPVFTHMPVPYVPKTPNSPSDPLIDELNKLAGGMGGGGGGASRPTMPYQTPAVMMSSGGSAPNPALAVIAGLFAVGLVFLYFKNTAGKKDKSTDSEDTTSVTSGRGKE